MASNPPFHLEDQTDEDFFDQLVNDDDDDLKVPASSTSFPSYGSDSDEVKAFANLSMGDESGGNSGVEAEEVVQADGEVQAKEEVVEHDIKAVAPSVEENSSVVFPSLSGFGDSVVDSNNGNVGTDVKSDPTISKSSGSNGSGVKEVQWSAFGADSAQNDINVNGFGSYSDFFTELGNNDLDAVGNDGNTLYSESKSVTKSGSLQPAHLENLNSHLEYQEGRAHGTVVEQATEVQDSSQDWENAYPGWKYNYSTGQWEPVDGYDPTSNAQENTASYSAADWTVSDGKSEVSYLQQTPHSVAGTVVERGMTGSVTNWNQVSLSNDTTWNQVSQGDKQYPEHMFFDDQYPGWYYDTIAQEWRSLDSYNSSFQSNIQSQDLTNQNGFASTNTFPYENHQKTYSEYGQVDGHASKDFISQGQGYNWTGSFNNNYSQHGSSTWQPERLAKNESTSDFSGHQQLGSRYSSHFTSSNHVDQNQSHDFGGAASFYNSSGQVHNDFSAASGPQTFVPSESFSQHFNQPSMKQDEQRHTSNDYYDNQNSVSFSQQQFQSGHQFSYAPTAGRSSAGRPSHALVSFGFGGKLIVMKNGASLTNSSVASQDTVGGSVSVLNLMEVFTEKDDAFSIGLGVCDYFRTLCRQSFPGPLSSGNVGIKELNKWIDERITYCESADMDSRKGEVLRLLLSLIKIACQHYGKLRSPFGTEASLKEGDAPESAVARLFASTKRNGAQFTDYGSPGHCLLKLPSDGQMRATASEVQNLLISGRTTEALHCAQQGHLWGPALVLAGQLGDQFYVETVKQMALRQLVAGSPLRTLCLLIAGQPADVFSMETTGDSGIPGAVNMSRQSVQLGSNGMLDNWEENLAVITANRTKDNELVLLHLGDCLWKERSDIIAAHICYLVAETNFEPYSDTARMCLIGADHWKFPRTYASPEAIQRTEVYEYSKVLGNSQFVLLPFQPYKILYAHMLAEVGRVSDSLKYCQAVLKSLKTGRAPEVEIWRQSVSSLEERIRTHQQGGFSANLAPAKLVGKLLNLFDSTTHRVVGGLPPPAPSMSAGSVQSSEQYHLANGPRVSTSQSTMAMSSLMPSESIEPISEWAADGNKKMMHNRSVSEPDFGRSPRQVDGKDPNSADGQRKVQATSRFGRFGFGAQLLQKTVGFLKPRQDKQAKLGETNKFYFDEKLKTWVEAGAEPPAEVAALAPPPSAGFQKGNSDYNLNRALKNEGPVSNGNLEYKSPNSSESSAGIPPLPPTTNQFSARGRMGVRSRYVDTFNQGGGAPTNLFQSPSVPSIKPANNANPKFFVPTPVSSDEQPFDITGDNTQESASIHDNSSVSATSDSVMSPPPSLSMAIQRFPSTGSISNMETSGNGALSSHSRRTASWSGTPGDAFTSNKVELRPLGEVLGMPPASFVPSGPSLTHSAMNGGSFGDDLHEVEL